MEQAMDIDAARERADELLASADYAAARTHLEGMLEQGEDAQLLMQLAAACRALGDIEAAMAALERALRRFVDLQSHAQAGLAACTLADLELTESGAAAVASGWLARARHHLEHVPDDPGHVYLESLCAYQAMAYDKDPHAARTFAAAAVAHGERVGDRRAELVARAYLGYIDVALGHLVQGFRGLDEVTAAALAGELSTVEALDVYCVLITACERVRDFDRVDQWARRVLLLSRQVGSESFAPFGRTAWANALIWRGRWDEADAEIDRVAQGAQGQPLTAALAIVLRSDLRRRQGRLDEADEELARAEREPYRRGVRHLVLAARARLELDRGAAQTAADVAARYLRSVSESDLIERVDAHETLVRARLELGQLDAASEAATELTRLAEQIPTLGVRAAAAAALAGVARARGELADARGGFEQAVALFGEAGLPHDTVEAQLGLAQVRLDEGDPAAARSVAEVARDAAIALGAGRLVAAATKLLAGVRGEPQLGVLTRREVEVLRLVAQGLANAEIAQRLVLSVRTIERHLSNIYLKMGATGPSARMAAVARARRSGLIE